MLSKSFALSNIAILGTFLVDLSSQKNSYVVTESIEHLKDPGMTHRVEAYDCGFYFYETDEDKVGLDMDIYW